MNVYQITPGFWLADCYGCFWHVIAETRGKARQAFISYWDSGIEWTDPMSIRVLAKSVEGYSEGVDDKYKWARATGYKMRFPEDVEEDEYA